ncbi:MAG: DUF4294 domain-containing protein [Bacteroidales bacterium]|nr:DUF4294 domain-containing protein [Bacteroidales bacterium]
MKRFVLIFLTLLLPLAAGAQARKVTGVPMYFEVTPQGDTVFLDTIEPVWCLARGKGMRDGDWRKYYKMVYNFNKVYPYALVGRKMMAQVDSTMAADVTKRSERNRYVNDVEKELFRLFEKDIKNMTISQGLVLMRLVDRECGMSAFSIIKTYENGFAANFWQLVAKMFSQDLKTRYDPDGKDQRLEELCRIWDSGRWDSFYFSIFMEPPSKVTLKSEHLSSVVRKK